jgi:hypothetical protein
MAPHSLSISSAAPLTSSITLIPGSSASTFHAGPGCHFAGPFEVCDQKTALSEIETSLGTLGVDQFTVSYDALGYEATHLPDGDKLAEKPQHSAGQQQTEGKDDASDNREVRDEKHDKDHHKDQDPWSPEGLLAAAIATLATCALSWSVWRDYREHVAGNDSIDLGKSPTKKRQD